MEKLSSTLKQLLTEANISEAELARRTGIAQPMVNRLATGKNKNPKLETLKPIAKYFSVTFSQLLGEEDLPESDLRVNQGGNTVGSQLYQLPLVSWDNLANLNLDNLTSERILSTTAKASEKTFAVVVNNNDLEPRFAHGTLLTIDPAVQYSNNDFVLVKDLTTSKISLMLVKNQEGKTLFSSLKDTNLTVDTNSNSVKVLGVLVQTRHDYK